MALGWVMWGFWGGKGGGVMGFGSRVKPGPALPAPLPWCGTGREEESQK